MRIQQRVEFDNPLAHEKKYYEYSSNSEQESSEYEADLDQQPDDEDISDLESDSSTLAGCSRDME